ncbi:hypothetical protein [Lactococcus protaetiae]|uniref:Uncharacterized protein n=1 Tax=Lactococcus protaetiae TaxID=2592653 RepID=A0A514Z7J4_9LACT|nr:hypothetical protein [Lactococcus protaetiae]QDK70523.1 hypothetical protein FLP15_04215 [Lactococcus protaetiae]
MGSIAAIISLFSACLSVWGIKRNIDANLRAKARIEWIQEVRKQTATVYKSYRELRSAYLQKSGRAIAYTKYQTDLRLLKLYFADNDDNISGESNKAVILKNSKNNKSKNKYLINVIDGLQEVKSRLNENDILAATGDFSQYYVELDELMEYISIYLKIEWDKAKKGK